MIFEQDKQYMHEALKLAKRAGELGEIPIGALVVAPTGEIIGRGYNRVEKGQCQVEHAEMRAIKQATRHLANWRLTGCTLYVTLEPCAMCKGLIDLSRFERLVYGADSPLFGYRLDKEGAGALYNKHVQGVTSGVLADEAAQLLRVFFSKKRMG